MPTILVADDDVGFRYALARYLSERGLNAVAAADGLQALQTIRDRNGAVDLVIAGVRMPNMDGVDLAVVLGVEYPHIPVLFVSSSESDPPLPCIDKAAELDVLHGVVIRALSGHDPYINVSEARKQRGR